MNLAPRSLLFVPASNKRALAKAQTLDHDLTIVDLEDAVGKGELPSALDNLSDFLSSRPAGKATAVRISDSSNPDPSEVARILAGQVDAIVVPKVSHPDTIRAIRQLTGASDVRLWAMIETALGVIEVPAISRAIQESGGGALIVGPNDLRRETRIPEPGSRAVMLPWLMATLLAARAFGLFAFDGVYNSFRDLEGFSREAQQAHAMGFDGKTLIHPDQIAPTHAAFAPRAEAIEWAQKVVAAFEAGDNSGRGVLSIDGTMVEQQHLAQARELLLRAQ